MRMPLLAALALGLAAPAAAQTRPDTTAIGCGQARSIVLRAGGIVLGTGGPTYDRFVCDRQFCQPTEYTRPAYAPTRDNPRCFVGYTCFEPGPGDWFGDF